MTAIILVQSNYKKPWKVHGQVLAGYVLAHTHGVPILRKGQQHRGHSGQMPSTKAGTMVPCTVLLAGTGQDQVPVGAKQGNGPDFGGRFCFVGTVQRRCWDKTSLASPENHQCSAIIPQEMRV